MRRKVGYDFVYFVNTKSGKILRNTIYLNLVTMFRQIGAIPSKTVSMPSYPESPEIIKGEASSEVEEALKQFLAFWEGGDYAALSERVGSTFILSDRATLQSHADLDAASQFLEKEYKAYKGLKFEVKELVSVGSYAAARVVKQGTYEINPMGSSTPLTREVNIDQTLIAKIGAKKIERLDIYYDELQLYKQFGFTLRQMAMLLSDKSQLPAAPGAGGPVRPAPADPKADTKVNQPK